MQFGPWPPPANLQNQPAESVSGSSAAQLLRIPRFHDPGCALQGATIRRRSEDRENLVPGQSRRWRILGLAGPHSAVIDSGASSPAPPCSRPAGWPSARTGIFTSLVLAWFFCRRQRRRRRWRRGRHDHPSGGMGNGGAQVRDSRRNPPRRRAGNRGWQRRSSRRASPSEPRANSSV